MKDFLMQYGPYILIGICFVAYVLWKNKNKTVKEQILALFLEAEKMDIVGPEKLKYVANFVYNRMDIGKKFMTQKEAEIYLQKIYDKTKEMLVEKPNILLK